MRVGAFIPLSMEPNCLRIRLRRLPDEQTNWELLNFGLYTQPFAGGAWPMPSTLAPKVPNPARIAGVPPAPVGGVVQQFQPRCLSVIRRDANHIFEDESQ